MADPWKNCTLHRCQNRIKCVLHAVLLVLSYCQRYKQQAPSQHTRNTEAAYLFEGPALKEADKEFLDILSEGYTKANSNQIRFYIISITIAINHNTIIWLIFYIGTRLILGEEKLKMSVVSSKG